ncbi:calcium-binding protein [Rhizobium sp. SGZ-381]|uniref:calcium-binding protein n=1 Tax=Rhizobium sp. SGZ-381 TaxID=3342800 RepID=UPI003671D954
MTIKKLALAALGATFLVGAAAPSFAAPEGRPHHGPGRPGPERAMMRDMMFIRLLKEADTNKDGKITREEVTAWGDRLFAAADENKDGVLTPGELRKYHEARMEEWREKRRAERAAEPKGPGAEPDEMADDEGGPPPPPEAGGPRGPGGLDAMKHDGGPRGEGPRGPHGRHHGMGPRGMMPMMALIHMADTDENGQISKAEATAAIDKLFDRMDRNKDGVITIDDLPDRPF